MKTFFLLLSLAFPILFSHGSDASSSVESAKLNNAGEPREVIERFFNKIGKGEIDEAYDDIFSSNEWAMKKEDAIYAAKAKVKTFLSMLGDYHGYEIIRVEEVGTCLIGFTCIAKFSRQPWRVVILFYRPNETWRTQSLDFDDKIDETLKEKLKQLPQRF